MNSAPVEDGETKAFLELTELDYEDACYNITNVQWSFIMAPSEETLLTWVNILRSLRLDTATFSISQVNFLNIFFRKCNNTNMGHLKKYRKPTYSMQ